MNDWPTRYRLRARAIWRLRRHYRHNSLAWYNAKMGLLADIIGDRIVRAYRAAEIVDNAHRTGKG